MEVIGDVSSGEGSWVTLRVFQIEPINCRAFHPTHVLCEPPRLHLHATRGIERKSKIYRRCTNRARKVEMPYLIESNEWRLLQEFGRLLDQKKARYYVQGRLLNSQERVQTNSELIEVELRRVFMVKEIHQNLDPVEFERCQAKLNSLCSLLDGLARSTNADSGTEGLAYPRLQALTSFIKSTPGNVDLASGSNETLFRLPHDAGKLCDCLRIVTECNDVLSPLLAPPSQAPVIQPLQKQQKRRAWKKAVIRNRAMFVLEILFKHFRCGTPHEVLLELNEDPDEDSVLPSLKLMLSPCFELESWQEARCDSVNMYVC